MYVNPNGNSESPLSPARTQEERRSATRGALMEAGRKLFARDGYEAVSSEALVADAGVTRGALYHHFDGKKGLFEAVFEEVEGEIVSRFDFSGLGDEPSPVDVLLESVDQFLRISLEADIQRIEAGLTAAIEAGEIEPVPVSEMALMLLGAMTEGALQLARAEDPEAARERTGTALRA